MLGIGTQAYPFIIQTPTDLNNVRNKITTDIFYELGNDIDMSTWGNFTPIGSQTSSQRFRAKFNGKGYSIKNLKIATTVAYTGFISFMDGSGEVKNVSFINADVSTTNNYAGIIAGGNLGSSTTMTRITNCFTSGKVNAQYHASSISGVTSGYIDNCYSTVAVSATLDWVYGIARVDSVTYPKISNCYFNGKFQQSLTNKYGVTGGTVTPSKAQNNYYNMDTTGLTTSDDNGIGLTDSQMKEQASFVGFDNSIWGFQNGNYPYLKVFGIPPIPSQKTTVNLNSHLNTISSVLERSKRKGSIALSYSANVSSDSTRTLQLMKNVISHIDEIVSNVATMQNANEKEYEVTSFVNGIGSNATRFVRTVRTVSSGINPIQIVTDIRIPIKIGQQIYATAYVIVNPSNIEMIENQSLVNMIKNQSNIKTVIYQSDTQTKENQSEMSVI